MKRLEIRGAEGGAEAEAFGRHAHDGEDGDRVHLHAADAVGDGVGVIAAEQVGHGEAVVEEPEMEFAGFQRAADAAVILGRGEILVGERMAPGPDEIRAVLRLQEPHQSHLPCHGPVPLHVRRKLTGRGKVREARADACAAGATGQGSLPRAGNVAMNRRWLILGVLFLARTAMGFQYQTIGSVAPSLIGELRIGFAEIGTLIGLYHISGVFLSLPGGLIIQRLGDKRLCAAGLAAMALGGLIMALSHSYGVVFAGRLISGMGAILFNLVITKMTADWFARREIVLAMAVILSTWPFGIALGLFTQPLHRRGVRLASGHAALRRVLPAVVAAGRHCAIARRPMNRGRRIARGPPRTSRACRRRGSSRR